MAAYDIAAALPHLIASFAGGLAVASLWHDLARLPSIRRDLARQLAAALL